MADNNQSANKRHNLVLKIEVLRTKVQLVGKLIALRLKGRCCIAGEKHEVYVAKDSLI